MSSILKVKDENGNWVAIPAIRGNTGPQGPKGDTGLQAFSIDKDYATKFRTETNQGTLYGSYLSVIRTDQPNITNCPVYSAGLSWGILDTHGYLNVDYTHKRAFIGGGNADRLNWTSEISLAGHTHSYLPLSGGTISGSLRINGPLQAYNYGTSNNTAAITLDKPGANAFGIGPTGTERVVQYGAVNSLTDGRWITGQSQIVHNFAGYMRKNGAYVPASSWGSGNPSGGQDGDIYIQI